MDEKTEIRAVEMVRKIRDRQAVDLRGKSNKEIIAYFRKSRKASVKRDSCCQNPVNKGMQPTARMACRG
jgi:hypothetical protein